MKIKNENEIKAETSSHKQNNKSCKRWKKVCLLLVVVGNQKDQLYWPGKSKQVPDAIKKATEAAKRNLIKIPLKEGRLYITTLMEKRVWKSILRSAPVGTGIIAGGAIRSVCEVLGIQDVVAKSLGSANPHNVLKVR